MSDKESSRTSFSKNKVGIYKVGSTGITGTPGTAIEPTAECEMDEDGNYSSSNLLVQNIDNIPQKLHRTSFPEREVPKALSAALQSTLWYDRKETDEPDDEMDDEIVAVEEEEDWNDTSLEGLSEDDVIRNLSHHLDLNKKVEAKKVKTGEIPIMSALYRTPNPITADNFCRGCGQNFEATDRFCGKCGSARV